MPHRNYLKAPLILFVENDAKDRDLITLVLHHDEARGLYRTAFVREGPEALAYLHQKNEGLAAVVIDLKMSKMSGLELLKNIRQFSRIPIVMLSSINAQTDVDACYESGANGYVVKPIDFRQFELALQTIALFWTINTPMFNR